MRSTLGVIVALAFGCSGTSKSPGPAHTLADPEVAAAMPERGGWYCKVLAGNGWTSSRCERDQASCAAANAAEVDVRVDVDCTWQADAQCLDWNDGEQTGTDCFTIDDHCWEETEMAWVHGVEYGECYVQP